MNCCQRVLMAGAITFVIFVVSLEEPSDLIPSLLPKSEVQLESKVSILEKCGLSSSTLTISQVEACLGNNQL